MPLIWCFHADHVALFRCPVLGEWSGDVGSTFWFFFRRPPFSWSSGLPISIAGCILCACKIVNTSSYHPRIPVFEVVTAPSHPTWTCTQLRVYHSGVLFCSHVSYFCSFFLKKDIFNVNIRYHMYTVVRLKKRWWKNQLIIPTPLAQWRDLTQEHRSEILDAVKALNECESFMLKLTWCSIRKLSFLWLICIWLYIYIHV